MCLFLELCLKTEQKICIHYENMPMQYTEMCLVVKIKKNHWKIFDIFLIFAQNIDYGYTLESQG